MDPGIDQLWSILQDLDGGEASADEAARRILALVASGVDVPAFEAPLALRRAFARLDGEPEPEANPIRWQGWHARLTVGRERMIAYLNEPQRRTMPRTLHAHFDVATLPAAHVLRDALAARTDYTLDVREDSSEERFSVAVESQPTHLDTEDVNRWVAALLEIPENEDWALTGWGILDPADDAA